MKIELLPKQFFGKGEVKGFCFEQVLASPNAYLYKVLIAYETYYDTFSRRVDTRFGKEYYPKSNAFGYSAWTYRSFDAAFIKFKEIM
ncbi:hypothetical protein [Sunxiuqinia sp. sy24]|uniref:hypothetical protein n=1 Tax=Sunxiuqinia sp. sy24 TaxID=3461495 RepID=UPI0040455C6F